MEKNSIAGALTFKMTNPKDEFLSYTDKYDDNTIRTEWDRLRDILGSQMAKEYAAGAVSVYGYPSKWIDAYLFRCEYQHVSELLGFEYEYGSPQCGVCGSRAMQTFPEDRSGPIEHAIPGMP